MNLQVSMTKLSKKVISNLVCSSFWSIWRHPVHVVTVVLKKFRLEWDNEKPPQWISKRGRRRGVVWPFDGNPDTRVTGLGYPVTLVTGHFLIFFYIFLAGDFFFEKKWKKLSFLSVFSLFLSVFLSLFLSFSVHTVLVLFSLINFTKVSCEG